jgi:hypothetical protein
VDDSFTGDGLAHEFRELLERSIAPCPLGAWLIIRYGWGDPQLGFLERRLRSWREINLYLSDYKKLETIVDLIKRRYAGSVRKYIRPWIDDILSDISVDDWIVAGTSGNRERIAVLWQICLFASDRGPETPYDVTVAISELKKARSVSTSPRFPVCSRND